LIQQYLEHRRAVDAGRQPARHQEAEHQEQCAAEIVALQVMQDLAQLVWGRGVADVAIGEAHGRQFQRFLNHAQEQEDAGEEDVGG
jgi:hypothetical protein